MTDSGIGISEQQQKLIFSPFTQAESSTQRRYGGTGLGLAIVKRMVDILGGSITVESAPGAGSTFSVLLPLQKTAAATPEATNPQPAPSIPQNKAILVAEDDDMNRQMIGSLLESLGAEITFAHNGQEAIEKARTMLEAGKLVEHPLNKSMIMRSKYDLFKIQTGPSWFTKDSLSFY